MPQRGGGDPTTTRWINGRRGTGGPRRGASGARQVRHRYILSSPRRNTGTGTPAGGRCHPGCGLVPVWSRSGAGTWSPGSTGCIVHWPGEPEGLTAAGRDAFPSRRENRPQSSSADGWPGPGGAATRVALALRSSSLPAGQARAPRNQPEQHGFRSVPGGGGREPAARSVAPFPASPETDIRVFIHSLPVWGRTTAARLGRPVTGRRPGVDHGVARVHRTNTTRRLRTWRRDVPSPTHHTLGAQLAQRQLHHAYAPSTILSRRPRPPRPCCRCSMASRSRRRRRGG